MGSLEQNTTLIYGVHIRESANDGSDFSNAASDYRVLFLGEDGQLHVKDAAGAVTDIGASSGAVATDTIWDAKGDLAAGTGANTAAKVTVGSNDTVLTADSAQSTGVKWQVPLPSKAQSGASADTSLSTDTIADVTGCSVSLAAGNWLIGAVCTFDTGAANYILAAITDNSNNKVSEGRSVRSSASPHSVPIPVVVVSPGSTTTYKLRAQAGASATVLRYAESTVPGTTMWAIRVV